MPKISIIVPVYNAKKYLESCINSLLNQTLSDIEIIIVDDGSTDGSSNICDNYKKIDSRISVIHTENRGVSTARNIGINLSKGIYTGFVDADDSVNAKMYESMNINAITNNADIVICGVTKTYEENGIKQNIKYNELNYLNKLGQPLKQKTLEMLLTDKLHGYSCNKLYRTELIKTNKVSFPENIPIMEDCVFNWNAFTYANTITYLDKCLYNYMINSKSACAYFNINHFEIVTELYKEKQKFMVKWDMNSSDNQILIEKWYIIQIIYILSNEFNKKNISTIKEKYKRIKKIVLDTNVREVIDKGIDNKESFNNYYKIMYIALMKKNSILLFLGSLYNNITFYKKLHYLKKIFRKYKCYKLQ